MVRSLLFETLSVLQEEQGYPPTRAELSGMLGVSRATVEYHLRVLQKMGKVILIPRRHRGIVLVTKAG